MFGWINDCTEQLVVSQYGRDVWHTIKETAGNTIKDGGFLRYKYYPDEDTVKLVVAASQVLDVSVDEVLHAFGEYFVQYVQDNGYSNVLQCLGHNLRDWLSNLNALHDHLQASYPKGFVAPVFWSQDDDEYCGENDGTTALLVQYYSKRGSLLVPLVVGLIKRVAVVYFDIEIDMELLQLQDEANNVPHTSWRITSKDPTLSYKLSGRTKEPNVEESKSRGETTGAATNGGDTSVNNHTEDHHDAFREGEKQAADLRTEEFVHRCFFDPQSELYHALTAEHYSYLLEYWKTNQIDGQWCYEKWSLDRDQHMMYPTLRDLPPRLQASSLCPHSNIMAPQTGKYPPDETGNLQTMVSSTSSSVPSSLPDSFVESEENDQAEAAASFSMYPFHIVNESIGKSQTIYIDLEKEETLQDALVAHVPDLWQQWSAADESAVVRQQSMKQCIVWDSRTNRDFHSFALSELRDTTTRQLVHLLNPGAATTPPVAIRLVFRCVAMTLPVGEDEQDI